MKSSKQSELISSYLWNKLMSMDCCYFDSKEHLLQELQDNVGRLREGDAIAVEINNETQTLRKVSGFSCLHDVCPEAYLVEYSTLESEYYEQLRR